MSFKRIISKIRRFFSCFEPEVAEPIPVLPAPRRPERQGTLKRVGSVKVQECSQRKRFSRSSITRLSLAPVIGDRPTGLTEHPVKPGKRKFDDYEENPDLPPRETVLRRRALSWDDWDRPLSQLLPPGRELKWTPSRAHLELVPVDDGLDECNDVMQKLPGDTAHSRAPRQRAAPRRPPPPRPNRPQSGPPGWI